MFCAFSVSRVSSEKNDLKGIKYVTHLEQHKRQYYKKKILVFWPKSLFKKTSVFLNTTDLISVKEKSEVTIKVLNFNTIENIIFWQLI